MSIFLLIYVLLSPVDWRLRPLVLITKLWAQFHDINNAKNMTISSYSLVLMVVHFLQYAVQPSILPCLHELYPEKFQLIVSTSDLLCDSLYFMLFMFFPVEDKWFWIRWYEWMHWTVWIRKHTNPWRTVSSIPWILQ